MFFLFEVNFQNDKVQQAAELFNEYWNLYIVFNEQFEDQEDAGSTVYARFKVGVKDKCLFESRFVGFVKVGWRSVTKEERMRIERRKESKIQ